MEVYTINKTDNKNLTEQELQQLTKEELISRVLQLESHNKQLKNIISKNVHSKNESTKLCNKRPFDFSKTYKRHIFLKFYYLGWDYQGFASQEDTTNTIEHHFFEALTKACLIESRQTSNYHRCGRTDKGVSAFTQVISLDIRSKISPEKQNDQESVTTELNYCHILNRLLPANIRCWAWAPVYKHDFSARFDCKDRTYKYFFPRGDLDIENMQDGCKYLSGCHDFRNLCKMDVANGVVSFMRRIISVDIVGLTNDGDSSGYDMFCLVIKGQAFLWHQIRCIMAILLLVGQKKEEPSIIKELLDVENNPCKPQYSLASDLPLNLYDCEYNDQLDTIVEDITERSESDKAHNTNESSQMNIMTNQNTFKVEWKYDKDNLKRIIEELQTQWTTKNIKSTMIKEMLKDLSQTLDLNINSQAKCLLQGVKSKSYQKLMQRIKCESLENRIEHYVKKRRLQATEDNL